MDHCENERRKANPRETANIFSLVTFSYIIPLLTKAFGTDLQQEDLYEVIHSCNSKRCGEKLEELWKKIGKQINASVVALLWRRFGWRYAWMCFINVVYKTSRSIIEPYALTNFISFFSQGQTEMTIYDAYYYGALVVAVNLVHRFYFNNFLLWLEKLGVEVKASFTSLIYRKLLKLTPSSTSEVAKGNMVTLITKDVQMLKESVYIVSSMASGFVQVCVICYLLFRKIGLTSFYGIGILVAAMPLQVFIGKWVENLRLKTGKQTDKRLQVTQETLSAIKIIKMYAWETFFENKINYARRKELTRMLLEFYMRSLLIVVGVLSSNIGLYVLIIAYIWMGSSADTSIVFYLVTNFKELKRTIGVDLPRNIGRAAEMVSAASRINKVLVAAESHCSTYFHNDDPIVELKSVTVHVGEQEILKDISFEVSSGLTIITGHIGSGKSTLLRAILENNLLSSGEIHLRGSISYASQEPWLFPSTIRQNILFGKKFDENRYRRVIQACALQYDFELLDRSDETILTDNGANLSKGQKTRINLARAIYIDSDIYLLDDSLSSLDSHVRNYIFNKCIKIFLKDKICILVSQSRAHVNKADTVVVIEKGKMKEIRKQNIKTSQNEKVHLEKQYLKKIASDESTDNEIDETTILLEREETRRNLIYREEKKEGKVLFDVYRKYVIFGGGYILLLMNLALGGITQISGSYADKILTMWVDDKQKILTLRNQFRNFSTENITINQTIVQAEAQENYTLKLYSILLFAATVLVLITTYVNFDFCRRASINIHQALVRSIMKASPSFFDSCFIGNILNRFSEDLAQLDENFPFIFRELLEDMFSIIGQMSLVLSVDKYFLVYISIAFIVLLVLGKVYIPSGRSLKRLEASTRSPMVGHLNASLEGLKTIRALMAEDILKNEFDRHQDLYTSALYTSICAMSAFTFFMDLTSCLLIIVVIIHFLLIDTGASSGNVGLALTQASMLGSTIQYAIRKLSVLENSMTSVERILEYTEVLLENYEGEVPNDWPVEGSVTFENVSLSYNKETILRGVSFKTEPKQNIGVMGRTGAGKTSMISLLFRLYDYQGKICIDGVDIKKLPLKFLRENIAVIPHDPLIFSGTIRSNIDPFGEFSDIDVAEALEKVKMKELISKLDLKITNELNFSSGQKQLFSLARVFLRKKKIIVMDEPSEYMDYETQVIVQNSIKENFQDCTIFMISHEVRPFLEFDKVMILNRGEIVEFEEPAILLRDKNGYFYELARSLNRH